MKVVDPALANNVDLNDIKIVKKLGYVYTAHFWVVSNNGWWTRAW